MMSLESRVHEFVREGFSHQFGKPAIAAKDDPEWRKVRDAGTRLWLDTGDMDERRAFKPHCNGQRWLVRLRSGAAQRQLRLRLQQGRHVRLPLQLSSNHDGQRHGQLIERRRELALETLPDLALDPLRNG